MMDDTPLRTYLRHLSLDEGVRSVHDLTEAQLLKATKAYLRGADSHEEHLDGDDRQTLAGLTSFYLDNIENGNRAGARTFHDMIATTVIRCARVKAIHRADAILTEMQAERHAYRDDAEMARDLMIPARSAV